jgi:hypothetical protein
MICVTSVACQNKSCDKLQECIFFFVVLQWGEAKKKMGCVYENEIKDDDKLPKKRSNCKHCITFEFAVFSPPHIVHLPAPVLLNPSLIANWD